MMRTAMMMLVMPAAMLMLVMSSRSAQSGGREYYLFAAARDGSAGKHRPCCSRGPALRTSFERGTPPVPKARPEA